MCIRDRLESVLAWLKTLSTSAANSLEEAFEDSLTVHFLGITDLLQKTLVTTNPIESAFDTVRTLSKRVKRWNGTSMVSGGQAQASFELRLSSDG